MAQGNLDPLRRKTYPARRRNGEKETWQSEKATMTVEKGKYREVVLSFF